MNSRNTFQYRTWSRFTAMLLLALGLCLPSCSTPTPIQISTPQDPALSFERIIQRQQERDQEVHQRRIAVDQSIDSNEDCRQVASLPFEDAREAWLKTWCAWRTERWSDVLEYSSRAIRYFELSGELRRVIELRAMRGFAAFKLNDFALQQQEIAQAQEWLDTSRELLPGALHDPYSGDLPYILARLGMHGIAVKPFMIETVPSTTFYLDFAHHEYQAQHQGGALAAVWRLAARNAWEDGHVSQTAKFLRRALLLDAEHKASLGLVQSYTLLAEVADALGDKELGDRVLDSVIDARAHAGHTHQLASLSRVNKKRSLKEVLADSDKRLALLTLFRARHHRSTSEEDLAMFNHYLRWFERLSDKPEDVFGQGAFPLISEIGAMFAERGLQHESKQYLTLAVSQIERTRRSIADISVRQRFLHTWRHVYIALLHQMVGIDTDRLPQHDYQEALKLTVALKARGLRDLFEGWSYEVLSYKQRQELEREEGKLLPRHVTGDHKALLVDSLASLNQWSNPAKVPGFYRGLRDISDVKLPENTVALEYILGERTGYVMVMTGEDIKLRKVAGLRELAPLWKAFREGLANPDLSVSQYASHREISERLYVALIAPVQDIVADYDRILIAPDEMLYELPFEALARPADSGKPVDYMFLKHDISYVPSMSILEHLHTSEHAHKRRTTAPHMFLMGAPVLNQSSLRLAALARELPGQGLESMSNLFGAIPESKQEILEIAKLMRRQGASVTYATGEDASEGFLRAQEASTYDVLHLATHGLSDGSRWNTELEAAVGLVQPALLLSRDDEHPDDGVLTLDEVLNMDKQPELVVLSGCTTGRGWKALGAGAYGFAGAFLYRGSRQVVATTWSVSDRMTRDLLTSMYTYMTPSLDAVGGLNSARRAWFIKEQRRRKKAGEAVTTPAPFYWASFKVVGEP